MPTGSDDSSGRLAIADGWAVLARFSFFFFLTLFLVSYIYGRLIFGLRMIFLLLFLFLFSFSLGNRLVGLWGAFGRFGAGISSVNNWDEV